MTIQIKKIAGNQYRFHLTDGAKSIQWVVDGNDVDASTLLDVINAENPHVAPTEPHYAIGYRPTPQFIQPTLPGLENLGAEAADKAAKLEELRLRNMGSALAKGINLGPEDIPVFNGEAGDNLPPVNWGV